MALEPTLRASLETSDPATIQELLDTARENARAEWLAIASPEGELLAQSGPVPVDRINASKALLDEAAFYDTGDVWNQGGVLLDVGVSSLVFGPTGTRLGVLVGGRRVDQALADELTTLTGQRVAFLADSRVAAVDSRTGPELVDDLLRV